MSNYRHPLTGHGEGCLCPRCDEVAVIIGRTEYEQLQHASSGNMRRLLFIADELTKAIVNEPLNGLRYPMAVYGMAREFQKELKKETRLPPLIHDNNFYMMRDALWDMSKCLGPYKAEPWRFAQQNPT